MNENVLRKGLGRYFTPEQLATLSEARIGIAGAGGLGSNAAIMLARSGIEHMTLVDHDIVEESNLNRQHYWPRHLGQKKIEALASVLRELNPDVELCLNHCSLDEKSLPLILSQASIWVEALDKADTKKMFVDAALASGAFVVSASGLCGYGGAPMRKKRFGNLLLVGDFKTGLDKAPPLAPRVTQAAAMLADGVIEYLLSSEPS